MHETNISRIDLNLFVIFDAIVREGSISAAARSLNLTQPAVSHALARLRERLDDELFVRRGRQMAPTARARALIGPVREALTGLQSCLSSEPVFDPGSARRTFVLGLRDGIEACVLPLLMRKLIAEAPGVEVQSLTVPRRDTLRDLASGRLDLAMDVQLPVSGDICQKLLVESPLVVLMRSGHQFAGVEMALDQYLGAHHVQVSSRRRGPGLEDFGLAQAGHQRQIALRCQHYQAALEVVAATDLLLTLPAVLATQLADLRLVSVALPLSMPSLSLYLYWHRDMDGDPGHRWLRELVL
jgi:DNA-binding transcriptional LysR family regulator